MSKFLFSPVELGFIALKHQNRAGLLHNVQQPHNFPRGVFQWRILHRRFGALQYQKRRISRQIPWRKGLSHNVRQSANSYGIGCCKLKFCNTPF